jgi:acyl-CoA thioesterase I
MSPNKNRMTARLARAAAATAVFVAFTAAHAQVIEPARIAAPSAIPVAAPAGLPAATPAVIAPSTRPLTALQHPAGPNTAQPVACSAPIEFTHFDRPLLRTAQRLASGEPLTIVAIGSSSTAGAGASSPDASYPSRLALELKQRFPMADITVLNRGVNGEETDEMMARFATGVIA